VLFGVTLIVFFMVHLLPGNPAVAILGQTATPERVAALSKQLGLDQPLWDQYLLFLGHLLQGNLGTSITYQRPVSELVFQDFPVTLQLLLYALVLSLLISVPLSAPSPCWARACRSSGSASC
jgi:peptide/nickel transport system permease protein